MIPFLIAIIVFLAAGAIIYSSLPHIFSRFSSWQEKRADAATKSLDSLFIFLNRKKLILYNILSPVIAGPAGYLFFGKIGLLAGLLFGLAVPALVLKFLSFKRKRQLENQIVDTLIMISSSLKAGLSIIQALEVVSDEMPPPISQEFGLVVKENRMGVEIDEALLHLKRRAGIDAFDIVITAILVARETGADLTQIFQQLVETMREETRLRSKIRALCTQGKIQGVVIALLPIVFAMTITKTQPKFFDEMLNDSLGKLILAYAVVSEIVGIFLIRILSKVEI